MINEISLELTDITDMTPVNIKLFFDKLIFDENNKPYTRILMQQSFADEINSIIFTLDDGELDELINALQSFKNGKQFYRG